MDREHGGCRGGGGRGILWMFEDDTSGCHSPTVSCRPPLPLTVSTGVFVPAPTDGLCREEAYEIFTKR